MIVTATSSQRPFASASDSSPYLASIRLQICVTAKQMTVDIFQIEPAVLAQCSRMPRDCGSWISRLPTQGIDLGWMCRKVLGLGFRVLGLGFGCPKKNSGFAQRQ